MERNELEAAILKAWPGSLPHLRHVPILKVPGGSMPVMDQMSLPQLEDLGAAVGVMPKERGPRAMPGQTRKMVEQLMRYYNGSQLYFNDIVNEIRWLDVRISEWSIRDALRMLFNEGELRVTQREHGDNRVLIYSYYDSSRPVREYTAAAGLQHPINRVDIASVKNWSP